MSHIGDKIAVVMIHTRKDPIAPVKVFDMLKERGYEPQWGDSLPHYGTQIQFPITASFSWADLDFLRPQYLPPWKP